MSAAQPIGPGSIVVCTSTQQNDLNLPPGYRLTKDALYCVDSIRRWHHLSPCVFDGCTDGFVLKGRERPLQLGIVHASVGYCPSQFRPLNDGDTSLVEKEETLDDANGAGLQTYRVLERMS